MQVRAIEFQENFRLVTLEAARQQSVINREGSVAAEHAATSQVEQRTADLGRPNPTGDAEASRVIDEGDRKHGRAGRRRDDREEAAEEETDQDARGPSVGPSIDFLA